MGSIHREVIVGVPASELWRALRDVAKAADLFRGILTDSRMKGDKERVVTFSNGLVVTERILDIDDEHRRIAYSAAADGVSHHNASMHVMNAGPDAARFVWITDFLPDEAASSLEPLIDEGIASLARRCAAPAAL